MPPSPQPDHWSYLRAVLPTVPFSRVVDWVLDAPLPRPARRWWQWWHRRR